MAKRSTKKVARKSRKASRKASRKGGRKASRKMSRKMRMRKGGGLLNGVAGALGLPGSNSAATGPATGPM